MNKNFYTFKLIILIIFSRACFAIDTTSNMITLSVTVVSPTCTIGDSQKEQTINLGDWATSNFHHTGDVSGSTNFLITLTDCPTFGNVFTVFTGVADSNNSSLLALSTDSTAKNVAIEILNDDETNLAINNESNILSLNSDGNVTLSYFSRYVSTADTVTAGTADGVATFVIYYE